VSDVSPDPDTPTRRRRLDVLWHHRHRYTYRRDTIHTDRDLSHEDVAERLATRFDLAVEHIRVDAVREVDSV
jgi:hypothetical protein